MLELIRMLLDKKTDPDTIAAALVLLLREGTYEDAKIAKEYVIKKPYVTQSGVLEDLYHKHVVSEYETNFEKLKISAKYKLQSKEDSLDMAEELWNKYPAVLPLSGGGSFLARKGDDKHEVLKMYLERIKHSQEKHNFVLLQLEIYVKLVLNQKINGLRIEQWISNEMWDTIPAIAAEHRSTFKTDI